MRAVLAAILACGLVGCARRDRDDDGPASGKQPAQNPNPPAPPAEKPPAAFVSDVYLDFARDAPAAERKYGRRVRFKMNVDRVVKEFGGYTVYRDIPDPDGREPPIRVRASFGKDQGPALEGLVGREVTATGVVRSADHLRLSLGECVVD